MDIVATSYAGTYGYVYCINCVVNCEVYFEVYFEVYWQPVWCQTYAWEKIEKLECRYITMYFPCK